MRPDSSAPLRAASIDVGTHSVRALVGDVLPGGAVSRLWTGRRPTRLGEGLESSGVLSPAAKRRTLSAAAGFARAAREHGAATLTVIATAAVREASNGAAFGEALEEACGVAPRILDGEEEALLNLAGVESALGRLETGDLLVDIGGGSTELTSFSPAGRRSVSAPLGAVRLYEACFVPDPPGRGRLDEARRRLEAAFPLPDSAGGRLVGTGGTLTTLAAMDQRLASYDPEAITGYVLTAGALETIWNELLRRRPEERRGLPGLEEGREDVILGGAFVARWLCGRLGRDWIETCDAGILEGALLG